MSEAPGHIAAVPAPILELARASSSCRAGFVAASRRFGCFYRKDSERSACLRGTRILERSRIPKKSMPSRPVSWLSHVTSTRKDPKGMDISQAPQGLGEIAAWCDFHAVVQQQAEEVSPAERRRGCAASWFHLIGLIGLKTACWSSDLGVLLMVPFVLL